jgi:hypothetical protein
LAPDGFGLLVGEPAIGLLCAGLALCLGWRGQAEAAAGGQQGKALAWGGMALGPLAGLGSVADLTPSPWFFLY